MHFISSKPSIYLFKNPNCSVFAWIGLEAQQRLECASHYYLHCSVIQSLCSCLCILPLGSTKTGQKYNPIL